MEHSKHSILAVLIAYNPDLKLLMEDINSFFNAVDLLYIWDNSPIEIRQKTEIFLRQTFPNIIMEGNGKNMGISYGLNKGWQYAKNHDLDVVLTMDQDSSFQNFEEYLQRVLVKWEKEGYCLCGPTPNLHLKKGKSIQGFSRHIAIITSGMLVPVELLDYVNGYCNDFLVDGIDFDICYKMRENGYESYMDNESNLIQHFGKPQYRTILGIQIHGYGYSPFRVYGIFRNHIIVWRRYHHNGILLRHITKHYFLEYLLKGVLLVEDNKWNKLKAACQGIVGGFRFKIKS